MATREQAIEHVKFGNGGEPQAHHKATRTLLVQTIRKNVKAVKFSGDNYREEMVPIDSTPVDGWNLYFINEI